MTRFRHVSSSQNEVCSFCHLTFGPGETYGSMDDEGMKCSFHHRCFRCCKCRKEIPIGQTFMRCEEMEMGNSIKTKSLAAKKFSCESCLPRCPICTETLSGNITSIGSSSSSTSSAAVRIHVDCFRCLACMKCIKGEYMTFAESDLGERGLAIIAGNMKSRTPESIKLSTLQKLIEKMNDKKPISVCNSCVDDVLPQYTCYFCNGKIRNKDKSGKMDVPSHGWKSSKTVHFHSSCFRCVNCSCEIQGSYMNQTGKEYICKNCFPRCPICNKELLGKTITVPSEQSENSIQIHADCWRCIRCDCSLQSGYFELEDDLLEEFTCTKRNIPHKSTKSILQRCVCAGCYKSILQMKEDRTNLQDFKRNSLKRRNSERRNAIENWSEDLMRGSGYEALGQLGLWKSRNVIDEKFCVLMDETSGSLCVAPLSSVSAPLANTARGYNPFVSIGGCRSGLPHMAGLNFHYLVEALRLFQFRTVEPVFSLDPWDPKNMDGPLQKKRFHPESLADTPLGEVLFQADYFLKKYSFGEYDDDPSVPKLFPSLFDTYEQTRESHCNRQWFVIDTAEVGIVRAVVSNPADKAGNVDGRQQSGNTVHEKLVLAPEIKIRVEARKLVKDPRSGKYVDAPYTHHNDPAVVHARDFSNSFDKLANAVPVINELREVAKAITVAKYLVRNKRFRIVVDCLKKFQPKSIASAAYSKLGVQVDRNEASIGGIKASTCTGYPLQIPTLHKSKKRSTVSLADQRSVNIQQNALIMFGGVDFSIPKIVEKELFVDAQGTADSGRYGTTDNGRCGNSNFDKGFGDRCTPSEDFVPFSNFRPYGSGCHAGGGHGDRGRVSQMHAGSDAGDQPHALSVALSGLEKWNEYKNQVEKERNVSNPSSNRNPVSNTNSNNPFATPFSTTQSAPVFSTQRLGQSASARDAVTEQPARPMKIEIHPSPLISLTPLLTRGGC